MVTTFSTCISQTQIYFYLLPYPYLGTAHLLTYPGTAHLLTYPGTAHLHAA